MDLSMNNRNMPQRQNMVHLIGQAQLLAEEGYPGIVVPCAQSSQHPKANGIASKRRTVWSNCQSQRSQNECQGKMAAKSVKPKIIKE